MPPHILIVADGRSPTAHSWIRNIQSLGLVVSLISTFPCEPPLGLKHFHVLPIAFSRYSKEPSSQTQTSPRKRPKTWVKRFAPLLQFIRYRLGPLTLPLHVKTYQNWVKEIQPDLVHALRIPFEGMLASTTPKGVPCVMATWGNDLTLHARGSLLMRRFTRRCLQRADGLTSDTHRDTRLAHNWGLEHSVPTLVVPGSGGIDLEKFQSASIFNADLYGIPKTGAWVVNPRGYRPGSVHQEVFFTAIPKVLSRCPETHFLCPNLAGNKEAEKWIEDFEIRASTHLLPQLAQPDLWSLFKESAVFVSPSSHDGTPNTFLESIASGCFPVVGDIESLREWITNGVNGFLVNPHDPDALADAIVNALQQPALQQSAAEHNQRVIKSRASLDATLPQIKSFYAQFIEVSNTQEHR